MDVTETRFGTRARDRDDFAQQIYTIFKRFLEEHSDEANDTLASQSSRMETEDETGVENTNDSFSSARSRPQRSAPRPQDGANLMPKYAKDALLLLNNERNTLFIDFKDIEMFDPNLAEDIIVEYYRFYPYLCRAVAAFVREEKIRQSEAAMDENMDVGERNLERQTIKKELDRPQIRNKDYYVGFYNFAQRDNIRDLSSTKIGTLTRVTGQVVRTHTVHPELIFGCFKCKDCLAEQYTEQQFRYTQPTICVNENCSNRTRYELVLEKSRFTDFQRLRIQETQQELPRGCIPRSFDVVVRGSDQVECIQPGDQVDFVGTLIAVPDVGQMMTGAFGTVSSEMSADTGVTGLKSMGVKEMNHNVAFLANACIIEGQLKPCVNTDLSYRETAFGSELNMDDFTKEEVVRIQNMSNDKNLLDNLSQSLFSSIYGSDDVKRGIVLQLLGGVPKHTSTGTKLRGDINICLVGDPSTAKSQILKIVTDFAPVKAVYTSGKASSASGLTAAVVRDTDGGFVIEAGALMLADRGICCIDEFDKMDLKDQVAMHEAMEQQTISITKAGVSATLNARASILAAANPIGGKYDTSRDLKMNLSFSLPIMSRFDLFFTIIDPGDRENDSNIAARVLDMHLNYANTPGMKQNMVYSFEDIRLYLRFARKYYPKIPVEAESVFVQEYVRLRTNSKDTRTSVRITVRQLESLIRLSEAYARAYCKEVVEPEFIRMAAKLIEKTIVHVGNSEIELPTKKQEGTQADSRETQEMYDGEVESQPLGPSQATHITETMSLAAYKQMAEVLMLKLRQESERDDRDSPAMRRSELIDWYLHQCVGEIQTETDLIKRKLLCDKVIDRLIKIDRILMELREDGMIIDPESGGDQPGEDQDRQLILNPTIEAEDFFEQVIP